MKLIPQIKARRLQLGLQQKDMKLRIGMNQQQYQRIEAGGNPRLETLELVAKGLESELGGMRGRVQDALTYVFHEPASRYIDPQRCHAFLCGNPHMIESVAKLLVDRGFSVDTKRSPGNLHFERYWA